MTEVLTNQDMRLTAGRGERGSPSTVDQIRQAETFDAVAGIYRQWRQDMGKLPLTDKRAIVQEAVTRAYWFAGTRAGLKVTYDVFCTGFDSYLTTQMEPDITAIRTFLGCPTERRGVAKHKQQFIPSMDGVDNNLIQALVGLNQEVYNGMGVHLAIWPPLVKQSAWLISLAYSAVNAAEVARLAAADKYFNENKGDTGFIDGIPVQRVYALMAGRFGFIAEKQLARFAAISRTLADQKLLRAYGESRREEAKEIIGLVLFCSSGNDPGFKRYKGLAEVISGLGEAANSGDVADGGYSEPLSMRVVIDRVREVIKDYPAVFSRFIAHYFSAKEAAELRQQARSETVPFVRRSRGVDLLASWVSECFGVSDLTELIGRSLVGEVTSRGERLVRPAIVLDVYHSADDPQDDCILLLRLAGNPRVDLRLHVSKVVLLSARKMVDGNYHDCPNNGMPTKIQVTHSRMVEKLGALGQEAIAGHNRDYFGDDIRVEMVGIRGLIVRTTTTAGKVNYHRPYIPVYVK